VDFLKKIDSSWVSVEASVPVFTYFMDMLDVDVLNAGASGRAEEGVGNIEISLVLDISGSMREPDGGGPKSQIAKLRTAAKSFFSQILTEDAKETTSINVIPYAGHVNVGPFLFDKLGGVRTHSNSSCLELTAADYASITPPASGLAQVPHFMNWAIHSASMDWGWCPQDKTAIIVAQNDKVKLDKFIDDIRLHDGTATHTGIKYGLMLLNPAMQSIFDDLAEADIISDDFDDRPKAWTTSVGGDVQKYLIVMTDGQITEQVRPKYTGVRDTDTDTKDNENFNGKADADTVDGVDYDLINSTGEMQVHKSNSGSFSDKSVQIAQFNAICNQAKSKNVVIFTIAFNAPAAAQTQMLNCADSPSYYYQVIASDDGTSLNGAFSSIVRTIKQLRLTQ
jgi:hypothetical protein